MELRFASYRQSKVLTANSAGAVVMFAADSINAAHDQARIQDFEMGGEFL